MKSIVTSIMESIAKTKKISGNKYFKVKSRDYDMNDEFKSNKWNRTEFNDNGSDIVAYWSQDCSWIFYYYKSEKAAGRLNWGAVSAGYMPSEQYTEQMFNNFEELCMEGATIPEFDSVETNVEI